MKLQQPECWCWFGNRMCLGSLYCWYNPYLWSSAGWGCKNTVTASLQRGKNSSPMSVLIWHKTISDSEAPVLEFGEFEVPLHCNGRCPWCNGYRLRKWARQHEFKAWTRLIAFHIALIPLGKEWFQLFSLQLWVNSRADGFFSLGEGTSLGEGKLRIQTC